MSRFFLSLTVFFVFATVIVSPLFYLKHGVYPYTTPKTNIFQILVEFAFFSWLALVVLDRRFRPRPTPFTWALLIYLGALLVTSYFAVDPWRSLWATHERGFGVVAFLHLGAFVFVLSSLREKVSFKHLSYASLATSLVVSVVAFVQLYFDQSFLLNEPVRSRPGSFFGNPTFLAGYLLFNLFLALYFFLATRKHASHKGNTIVERLFLAVVFIVDLAALFITQTRGDLLGFGAGIFLLFAFFAYDPPEWQGIFGKRHLYAGILLVLVLFGGGFWVTRSARFWSYVPGFSRFREISFQSANLQPRLIALHAAWQGFLERPVLGYGPENFYYVYNKHYDPRALEAGYEETRFDKPHNLFLENLATGGLVLTLAFLFLIGAFIYETWHLRERFLVHFFLAALFAYLVRSTFIFDTLGPALLLYLLFGVADGMYRSEFLKEEVTKDTAHFSRKERRNAMRRGGEGKTGREALALCAFLPAFIFAYWPNYVSLAANNDHYWGLNYLLNGKVELAIQSFQKGSYSSSPYNWGIERDYGITIASGYFNNPGAITKDEAWGAIHAMEHVANGYPKDAYNHSVLVDLYNQTSDLDPAYMTSHAEEEAKKSLELSPNRQETYFSLAKTEYSKGESATAIMLVKHAIELDPKVPDGHFYYGLLAYATKDSEMGYKEIKEALALGRQWTNAAEAQKTADFFADSGNLSEAIDLYRTAISLKPADLESKAKLAIAYFMAGRRDEARSYLLEVSRKYDLRQSVSYSALEPILRDLHIPL